MSQQNARLVRDLYDCFNRGDVEAVVSAMDAEIEFRELESIPGSEVYHGHAGFRRFVAKLADAFEELRYEVREAIPAGDQVVVVLEAAGRGRDSGVAVTQPLVSVWTVRGGKLVRHVAFAERDEALEAVGLAS